MSTSDWINHLDRATLLIDVSSNPPLIELAAASLRLGWRTTQAVQIVDAESRDFWHGWNDAIADVAARVDKDLKPPGVQLGTGARPSGPLEDTPELRAVFEALLDAGFTAHVHHVAGAKALQAREDLARALTTAALILGRPDPLGDDGFDRQMLTPLRAVPRTPTAEQP